MSEEDTTQESHTAAEAGSSSNDKGVAAGSEANRQSQQSEERLWTQAEVEQLVKTRLDLAQEREEKKREQIARQARIDEAKKAGQLDLLLKEREGELEQVRQELATLKTEQQKAVLASLRAKVITKHFAGYPPHIVAWVTDRLAGETEAELEADAIGAKKLWPREAPDNQSGERGRGGLSEREAFEIEKMQAARSGRYGSY